ncbi:MAG: radical SAM protein, partial [Pirellulaceae bacterium]|nr:radical SAM protein [Pirellulaceae bacterium]
DGQSYVMVIHNTSLMALDKTMAAVLGELVGQSLIDSGSLHDLILRCGTDDDADELLEELMTFEVVEALDAKATREDGFAQLHTQLAELPVANLVTQVAKDCNLRCGYCYAEFGLYGGESGMMKPEMARSHLDYLLLNSKDAKNVTFTLFGGEPLMNWPVCEDVIRYGREREKVYGKRINFTMTTNGTLLTQEIADFLVENEVSVTVSIDGPKEVNDAIRPTAEGEGSFDTIVEKLKLLTGRMRVPARVTLTRKFRDVKTLVESLLAAGFTDVGVSPVSSTDPELKLTPQEMQDVLDGFQICVDRFVADALKNRIYGFTNIVTLMQQFHEGSARSHACGAGVQLFAADSDGDYYLCHRFSGMKDYAVGNVKTGIDQQIKADLLDRMHVSNKDHCGECEIRHVCAGGCYYYSELYEGDVSKTYAFNCNFLRAWYRMGLYALVRITESNPAFLERLWGGPGIEPLTASTRDV